MSAATVISAHLTTFIRKNIRLTPTISVAKINYALLIIRYFARCRTLEVSSDVCDICGEPGAHHVCKRCGRRVCDLDYDENTGLCRICLETNCEICSKYPAIGYCMVCGRIGCEDCLVQISMVAYVCKECIRKGVYNLDRQ